MGFITVDHNKAQQGRYMAPEGIYECLIHEAKFDKTAKGTEYIHITLGIRDDVPQEGQGENIDWPVWKKKEPSRQDPNGFPAGTIQHISRVVKLANGADYATIDDWFKAITRKPIRVEVKHEEYLGTTRARVGYVYETEHPKVSLAGQGFVQVGEDDLPF